MKKITLYIYILIAGSMLLSSCSLWKAYESQVQVPDHLCGEDIVASNDTLTGWRNIFTDAQLQQLIEKALTNNHNLRQVEQNVKQAEAMLTSAKLGYLPTLALPLEASISQTGSVTTRSYSFPLYASWQLDVFGSVTNTKRSAAAQLAYQQDYQQSVECSLIQAVATSYYTLVMLDRQNEVAKQMIEICEESHRVMQALFESAVFTSPAVHQQEAQMAGFKAKMLDLEHQIHKTETALCLLLGDQPHSIERNDNSTFALPVAYQNGLPLDLLHNRPDVRAAERSLETAYYGVKIAKAQLFPNITLEGTLAWVYPTQVFKQALASLTQPIFQQGKLRANVKVSEAQQEQARLQLENTLLKAANEVNNAYYDCKITARKAEVLEQQVSHTREAYTANQELMNNGKATYLEVLTAQNDLFNSQLSQLSNEYEQLFAIIDLYTALGGK